MQQCLEHFQHAFWHYSQCIFNDLAMKSQSRALLGVDYLTKSSLRGFSSPDPQDWLCLIFLLPYLI